MEDVVNEVLGDADPNDRVRFAILSSNFDRALNTMYQPRSEVTGVALAELFGKMLQSNQSIDNDLTLHVQRVNLPRGNGLKRNLAVNMGLNLLLKRRVFTAARQYDDVPCFGYALALAIMLKDHKPIMSIADFPFINKRYWTEFTIFLTLLISRMAPWTLLSTPNLSPSSPRTAD